MADTTISGKFAGYPEIVGGVVPFGSSVNSIIALVREEQFLPGWEEQYG